MLGESTLLASQTNPNMLESPLKKILTFVEDIYYIYLEFLDLSVDMLYT